MSLLSFDFILLQHLLVVVVVVVAAAAVIVSLCYLSCIFTATGCFGGQRSRYRPEGRRDD